MSAALVLASGSVIRRQLLQNAGVEVEVRPARIDEDALRDALLLDGAPPRDIADHLAEAKARKVSGQDPGRLVLGCDQILAHDGEGLAKPEDMVALRKRLQLLRGETHHLFSAAVLCRDGAPLWRQITEARLEMHRFSETYLDAYIARNGTLLLDSVGGYMFEAEGVRLFSRVVGDYFTILGLPLIPILRQLALMGEIET
ncbi:MAG: Maf family protein [Pseudomonadota bacterium]